MNVIVALKAAHRNAACVVQAGVHISCVFTLFLSFMICSSRTGHPTEVFRSTHVCSSRTCAQAKSSCLWEQCACTFLVISLRGGSCSFVHVWSRAGIPSHTHTFGAVTHSQYKFVCRRNVQKMMLMLGQMQIRRKRWR